MWSLRSPDRPDGQSCGRGGDHGRWAPSREGSRRRGRPWLAPACTAVSPRRRRQPTGHLEGPLAGQAISRGWSVLPAARRCCRILSRAFFAMPGRESAAGARRRLLERHWWNGHRRPNGAVLGWRLGAPAVVRTPPIIASLLARRRSRGSPAPYRSAQRPGGVARLGGRLPCRGKCRPW